MKENLQKNSISDGEKIDEFEKFALSFKDNDGNTFFILDEKGCIRNNHQHKGTAEKCFLAYKQFIKKPK